LISLIFRKKMMKKMIIILGLMMIFLSGSQFVYAQRQIDPSLKPIYSPEAPQAGLTQAQCTELNRKWDAKAKICKGDDAAPLNAFLQILAGALLMLSGGLAVIVVAVGGVMYITSHGDQQQLEYAKNTIVYGLGGSLVVIFSYMIVRIVIVKLLELG
jgi:hypothetical protein